MILIAIFCVCLLPSLVTAQVEAGQIAFTTSFREDRVFGEKTIVKYSDITTNHGGAYSKATGLFTVPRNGVYAFSIHGTTQSDKSFTIDLFHNDLYVASAYANQAGGWASGGNTALIRVVKGDKVFVKTKKVSEFFGRPDEVYVTFSGFMLGLLSIPEGK